ncbi:MAG TPA: glycosyltransferase 87 family protein [Anaerolineales bacterium]|nr:glycosyltransferase 87 family protein [Anaerolineales bacterium]
MVTTTTAQARSVSAPYEVARTKLIGWGALTVMIYLVFLIFFPLIPTIYHSTHVLEIEQMLRHGRRWFAPLYLLALGTLFYAFWQELNIVHTLSKEDPGAAKALRVWVLGIGVLSGVILINLYPISALDVVLYVVRARLWALYGGSPMLALPASFPGDPYIRFAGEYAKEVSPYGPLWELIAQIPVRFGILDIGAGVIAMKAIALISYISMAVLIGWHARQDVPNSGISSLTALTFFALNPLVLMQAIGNGHNDMVMLVLMTLGLVFWQRGRWAWAAFALTLATLIKVTGLILMPLFGVAVLAAAPNWRSRLMRGLGIAAIFLITAGIAYRLTGPFPEVFAGAKHAMFGRWGYAPTYAILAISQAIFPQRIGTASMLAGLTREMFILYYVYLLIRIAQGKMTLARAGFMAYFSQLLLGTTFRIWYPMWLIPFAALSLTSGTYWRTFLFSLTAELSIFVYLIGWRWELSRWDWGIHGPLANYWSFWLVMTVITVPWVFGIPLLGPVLRKWKDRQRFSNSFWI